MCRSFAWEVNCILSLLLPLYGKVQTARESVRVSVPVNVCIHCSSTHGLVLLLFASHANFMSSTDHGVGPRTDSVLTVHELRFK